MQNNENLENLGVDPNDAPEGFIAVAEDQDLPSCSGCYYQDSDNWCNRPSNMAKCTPMYRKDGKYVIFVKKQATLSYPCGSLGEEIE